MNATFDVVTSVVWTAVSPVVMELVSSIPARWCCISEP